MKKKVYVEPDVDIVEFSSDDIVTVSGIDLPIDWNAAPNDPFADPFEEE